MTLNISLVTRWRVFKEYKLFVFYETHIFYDENDIWETIFINKYAILCLISKTFNWHALCVYCILKAVKYNSHVSTQNKFSYRLAEKQILI